MKYNLETMGRNIVNRRTALHLSQKDMMEELQKIGFSPSRNTMSKIENGKPVRIDLELLKAICTVLKCDIGHLLGEYECSTVDVQAISDYTGLSEEAIEFMHESLPCDGETDLVSSILSAFLTPAGVLISSEVGRLLLELAKYKEFAPAFSEKGSDGNRVFRENTLYRIRERSAAIDKAVSDWVDFITDRRSIIEEIESAT